jgi:hypothetical protein
MKAHVNSQLAGALPRLAALCAGALALGGLGRAQGDGPRMYWHGLSGTNVVPVLDMSITGNSNPLDYAHRILPQTQVDAHIMLAGYGKAFPLFDRAATVSALVPMGTIASDTTVGLATVHESASGVGDPTLQFTLNLIGPPAMMNIPDVLRYEPGFSVDFLASLMVPIGEYDSDSSLNLGQNRWYGRVGAPVVWQLGTWEPDSRTTLEFLPALWLFGDNTDYGGQTLDTDPVFQFEGHLTHNFAKNFWGSLDGIWYGGGQSSIGGVEGSDLSALGLGFTLGYELNDNLFLTLGRTTSINDDGSGDLKLDELRIGLTFGWHPLVEGMKRLQGGE